MIADFYSKPLQGRLFRKLRDRIMDLLPILSEERVEENADYVKFIQNTDKIERNKNNNFQLQNTFADVVKRSVSGARSESRVSKQRILKINNVKI